MEGEPDELFTGSGGQMKTQAEKEIFELAELRNRERVFRDRDHAGAVLAEMLETYRQTDALVLGIPAGGIPVAAVIAHRLSLALDVAVVSKITLPWNSEAGYGAVAFDGTVRLNESLVARVGLTDGQVQKGIEKTSRKVRQRIEVLRGERPFPSCAQRPVILVDDGLASGFTLRVAVEALRNAGADRLIVAVPTGHGDAARGLAKVVDALYCPNLREGWVFAVADAYRNWMDLDEERVRALLEEFAEKGKRAEG